MVQERWKTDTTVFIGDIVDAHRWGRWDPHHKALSSEAEYKQALKRVAWWHENFPNSTVTIGNHDERAIKQARSVGIPDSLITSYKTAWQTPTWEWVSAITIDGVRYFHGEGFSGKFPHVNAAITSMKSTVMGHIHTVSAVQWMKKPGGKFFGMCVGCGVNSSHPYMAYAAKHPSKPMLSCGVVIEGRPYLEVL